MLVRAYETKQTAENRGSFTEIHERFRISGMRPASV